MSGARDVVIRRAGPKDVDAMCDVHKRSIREIASKDYTPEQVAAWAGFVVDDEMRGVIRYQIEHEFRWVVEIDGRIEGFSYLLNPTGGVCRLEALYLSPVAAGQGLGRRLMELAEEQALRLGATRMDLISSVTAHRFYEHLGFRTIGGMEPRTIRGSTLPTYRMEKSLATAPATP